MTDTYEVRVPAGHTLVLVPPEGTPPEEMVMIRDAIHSLREQQAGADGTAVLVVDGSIKAYVLEPGATIMVDVG